MQDCYHERDSGIGDFEERDSGNNHLNKPRTGMSVDKNLWRNWSFQSTKSTRQRGSLASGRWSGCSATLLSYCAAIKIISEAKFPIYQKSSMAQRVTRHLRLLRQLKCLTASKTPMVLDYPRNFGNVAKDGLKRTTRWAVYYFTNPNSWFPVLGRAMILSAIPPIQPLPPLQVTVQSIQKRILVGCLALS